MSNRTDRLTMEKNQSMEAKFLNGVHQLIQDNLANEDFSVEDLAEGVGVSRSVLHRKLVKLTGKSPNDHITEFRLQNAKDLLVTESVSVSEVAYRVGYKDPSYFNKVFKKHFGISPGDVKKSDKIDLVYSSLKRSSKSGFIGSFRGIVIIALIIAVVGWGIYYTVKTKTPKERSIAVLPLHNLTGQPANDHFIDGLQDALIGELGRIKSIRVISRTSTLGYRDKEMLLSDIAGELGVNTIVEGSVSCLGDSLCLIIQLLDVFPEERHLLATEYREGLQNVLKIQRTAVKDIAKTIDVTLSNEQKQYLSESRTVDPETYKEYLRGLYQLGQGTPGSFYTGIDHMKNAIERDPGDPLAHAGLALGYAQLAHGYLEAPDAFRSAEAAANKALKLDPNLDEAYIAIAMLNNYNFWNWPKAKEAFENALTSNPNSELAHAHYAWYYVLFNDKEKSLYHARMATVLDPLSPAYYAWYAWLCIYFEEFQIAEINARKALEFSEFQPFGNLTLGWVYLNNAEYAKAIEVHMKMPLDYPFFKMVLAHTYVQAGEIEKAKDLRNEVEEIAKNQWVNPLERGLLAGMLGDSDSAFELINEAVDQHYYPTNHINVCIPGAEFLKEDARYQDLFIKMNLPYRQKMLANRQMEE